MERAYRGRLLVVVLFLAYFVAVNHGYIKLYQMSFNPTNFIAPNQPTTLSAKLLISEPTVGPVTCVLSSQPASGPPGLSNDFSFSQLPSYCQPLLFPIFANTMISCTHFQPPDIHPPTLSTSLDFTFYPLQAIRSHNWIFNLTCYDLSFSSSLFLNASKPLPLLVPQVSISPISQNPILIKPNQKFWITITVQNNGQGDFLDNTEVSCGFQLGKYLGFVQSDPTTSCGSDGSQVQCSTGVAPRVGDSFSWNVYLQLSDQVLDDVNIIVRCVDSTLLIGNVTTFTVMYD